MTLNHLEPSLDHLGSLLDDLGALLSLLGGFRNPSGLSATIADDLGHMDTNTRYTNAAGVKWFSKVPELPEKAS